MSLIESQFELKTKKGENKTEIIEAYRVLVNFWNCIKVHVPNVLSCITQVFPHYTKHDVSHSYAILDSIERILGKEAIEKLSVTDLWLLLCSAYYHDIGMYISGNEIEKCFKSDEFKNYVIDLKDDTKSPLNKYAGFYVSERDKLNYDKCELTLDSYNSARFLLAAFFRDSHADRSENFLQSDSSVAEMFSEIKRLITVIAEICRLHCAKFEEVMEFSEVENGVNGIEDYCHPRFVACMLRMGDLLDFDSSRVSRFSLDHLSTSIPYDSKIHNEKNYCIKRALITPEKVDVYAECEKVEVAFEIDKWFTMIREEMSNQRNAWHDIASSTGIKGFPMCGKLETKLSGYEKIDNKLKAKFEVEGDNAVKILQGSGIYDNKFQCIREILQNSVDATYLRIYLEKLNEKKIALQSTEGFDDFLELCEQPRYQIEVRCKKKEIEEKNDNKEEADKNKKKKYIWHLEIQDHGIGIRKEDLKFLLKIGSGKNNKEKFDIIKNMPEYAKPSGIFGIGFQSIFLITDEVNIKSRYALCDEVVDMTIGTPLKGGFALLKTEKNPFAEKGTTISFDVKNDVLVEKEIIRYRSFNRYYSYYECFNESYDFIKNKTQDVEIAKILNAASMVGRESYLNIVCCENDVKKKNIEKTTRVNKKIYEDRDANLIVEISKNDKEKLLRLFDGYAFNEGINILYRNEYVNNHNLSDYIKYLQINVNILSGKSDDILSVSRNYLKPEYSNKIKEPLKKLIIQWLIDFWNNFSNEDKKTAAMFLEYYEDNNKYENEKKLWRKNKIEDISFEKSIKYDSITIIDDYDGRKNEQKHCKPNQKIMNDSFESQKIQFLAYALKKYYHYGMHFRPYLSSKEGKKRFFRTRIEFTKESKDSVDWKYWLIEYRNMTYRSFMPCYDYPELQIKENKIPKIKSDPMNVFEKVSYPKTVCPYIVKNDRLEWDCSDEVVQWVLDNNIKNVDGINADLKQKMKIEIENGFNRMKKDFEKCVKKINDEVEKKQLENDKSKKGTKPKTAPKSQKPVEEKAELKTAPKLSKPVSKKMNVKAPKAKAKKS